MCHQAAIILADFTNRKYIAEVPDDEQLAFIDYCAAVLAGEAPFYGPDEAPFQMQRYRRPWRPPTSSRRQAFATRMRRARGLDHD